MPIYEYACECGVTLETLERVGSTRRICGELCRAAASDRRKGHGHLERVFSTGLIRGDGREAKEPVFDPCKRANRPGGGCED